MKKILMISVAAGLATLAGCASAPTPQVVEAPPPPKPVALTASAKADQAATAKFGPRTFKPGEFVWSPAAAPGETKVVISLKRQLAWVYQGEEIIGIATVSSGSKGHESPWGVFPIMEKRKVHRSNRYSNAPMPFMQRLNKWGVALHGGVIPGYPASHGCIRLPVKFAEKLFGVTKVGTEVIVDAPNV
ncbi:L,D-transpeptidase family protein [Sphingomonas sp.]|uniref:L,D-transpeptidase family protein n=1 Tax=Sphingomonas sp. TaxID=28214 RepID=UPI00286DF422|nr:L,D-transpeptidase family protein [Sphingomonas sp.]